jgi:hypothetical protein
MPTIPSSCASNPLIKLGNDAANAPVLNYNLEQENCRHLFSAVPFNIPEDWFNDYARTVGTDAFWDTVTSLSIDEIKNLLKQQLQTRICKFLDNYDLIDTAKRAIVFYEHFETRGDSEGKPLLSAYSSSFSFYKNKKGQNSWAIAVKGNTSNIIRDEEMISYTDYVKQQSILVGKANGIRFPFGTFVEFDIDAMVAMFKQGFCGHLSFKADGSIEIEYYPRGSREPKPQLYVMYETLVCSYLGNYGAGRTVNTFSLLPGEKTTITVRTYKESKVLRDLSSSFIDASDDAQHDSLDTAIQTQTGDTTDGVTEHSEGKSVTKSNKGGLIPALVWIGGKTTDTSNQDTSATHTTHISTTVSNSVAQSVHDSNQHREVNINTSTSSETTTEEETSIVRELENINLSRTLNFVFRQLLQEYIVVHWLKNIKFIFSNGTPGSYKEVQSVGLEQMLKQVLIDDSKVREVKIKLLAYCQYIFNFNDDPVQFFECKEFTRPDINCDCDGNHTERKTECLWVRKRGLSDTFENITVPGVIFSAGRYVLKTPSVIVDSLLGQGEALDCYNMNLQQEGVRSAILNNDKVEQAINIIDGITDPLDKAIKYKKVFSNCCDVPQSGCGCSGTTTTGQ